LKKGSKKPLLLGIRRNGPRTPNGQKFFGSFFQKRTFPFFLPYCDSTSIHPRTDATSW
jgi:hypothetical protein